MLEFPPVNLFFRILFIIDEYIVLPSRALYNDALIIVISYSAGQLFVGHLRFILSYSPASVRQNTLTYHHQSLTRASSKPGNFVRVNHFELPALPRPHDLVFACRVTQHFQQELPKLNRSISQTLEILVTPMQPRVTSFVTCVTGKILYRYDGVHWSSFVYRISNCRQKADGVLRTAERRME